MTEYWGFELVQKGMFKRFRAWLLGWLSKLESLFGSLYIIRHLLFRVPQKRTLILTTTQVLNGSNEPKGSGLWLFIRSLRKPAKSYHAKANDPRESSQPGQGPWMWDEDGFWLWAFFWFLGVSTLG